MPEDERDDEAERTEAPEPEAAPDDDGTDHLEELLGTPDDDDEGDDDGGEGLRAEGEEGEAERPAEERAPAAGEPEAEDAAPAAGLLNSDELAERLRKLELERDEDRRNFERERSGLRRELTKLRERRRAQNDDDEGDEAAAEAAADLIAAEWAEDGTTGIPRARIVEIAREVLRQERGAAPADPNAPPEFPDTPDGAYQRFEYERAKRFDGELRSRRERVIADAPDAEPLLDELAQAERWVDAEIGAAISRQGGFANPRNDPEYVRHWLSETGIAQRFATRFPHVGRRDLVELIETSVSKDPDRIEAYMRDVAGVGPADTPPPSGGGRPAPATKRIPAHPSHVGRGRGAREDEKSSKERRYQELDARDPLELTDAEWVEYERLDRELHPDEAPPPSREGRTRSIAFTD